MRIFQRGLQFVGCPECPPRLQPFYGHSLMPNRGVPSGHQVRPDGTEVELRPARLTLARVSVVRANPGPKRLQPCIDDYIRAVEPVYGALPLLESISVRGMPVFGKNAVVWCRCVNLMVFLLCADYLTKFSGITHGDLDPGLSRHHLTTLKAGAPAATVHFSQRPSFTVQIEIAQPCAPVIPCPPCAFCLRGLPQAAYLKLRYLCDCGVKFVGHGLRKDFRMINIVVPPEQVRLAHSSPTDHSGRSP